MTKTHFTRKNLISIALVFFYALSTIISGLAIDGNNPVFAKNNPIQNLAASLFKVKDINGITAKGVPSGSIQAYILLILFAIYIVLCTAAIIYEVRLAKYYDESPLNFKWWSIYIATFILCGALWIGISMVSQISSESFGYYLSNSFLFLLESVVVGLIVFAILGLIIFNICALVVNFKKVNKPFIFFDDKQKEKEDLEKEKEEQKSLEQGKLAEAFGETSPNSENSLLKGGNGVGVGSLAQDDSSPLKEKERVFPGLCTIDYANSNLTELEFDNNISLKDLCVRFRNYLAKEEGLYFSLIYIQEFISAFSASRLIILEGLSGTGKSSLARYFSKFLNEQSYFEAVQATWRDRSSLLGFYNDFSKTYNETEFLKRLYDASYKKEHINIMVLDELNISRIEYYFADFLSVLEYPQEEWKIKIMQFPYDFDPPSHLQEGILQIPENTYFIGTANKDESTYTITDKVYDRAININFEDKNEPFDVDGDSSPISISYNYLQELFTAAILDKNNQLTVSDYNTFKNITDYTYNVFELTFGNRILRQIQLFVPVFVACGGSKQDALDFMFARKVICKLEGRFDDYIKPGLIGLKELISKTYGENSFAQTNHMIDKLLRKL